MLAVGVGGEARVQRTGVRLSLLVPPSVAVARCTLGLGAISERGGKMDAGFFRVSRSAGI